jgi:hypothetical protein
MLLQSKMIEEWSRENAMIKWYTIGIRWLAPVYQLLIRP